jgi:glycosyltransferase involved in cell wall biosynthesis
MKTLLLCPALFASHGGIERILRLYLKAVCELSGEDDRVALAVLNDAALTADQLRPFATAALGPVVAGGRRRISFTLRTLLLARHTDRLVCGHANFLPVLRLVRLVNRRAKQVLVAHGTEVWRPFRAGEQAALRQLDAILCVSDYTRQQLLARCPGLDPARCHVQFNALDPSFAIAPAAPPAGVAGRILAVSRLAFADAYKGIDQLIRALPAVRAAHPEAHLRIVGDGDDRPRLTTLAAECGVTSCTEFLGRIDDAALRAEFASCRLFALPSTREGFGLVFLEAMAHGRPCLGVRAGGAPEVLDADTGVLVAPDDVAALAHGAGTALSRTWDAGRILARARAFSYSPFQARLASLLSA